MKNSLNLIHLWCLMMISLMAIDQSQAQSISYNSSFDLSNGATYNDNFLILGQTGAPRSMIMNPDGTKLYVAENGGEVFQYSLVTPFEISGGVSYDNVFQDLSSDVSSNRGMAFNNTGEKLFVLDIAGDVHQFSVSIGFDLSSTVEYDDIVFDANVSGASGLIFNPDGTKMYVNSSGSPYSARQYTLSTPFDISTGVTVDGLSVTFTWYYQSMGMAFNNDGTKLYSVTPNYDVISEYLLSTPYDITTGVTKTIYEVDISNEEGFPRDLLINQTGTALIVLGDDGNDIIQYDLNPTVFNENGDNKGGIENSAKIHISGDTFTHAGGTLIYKTDYGVSGIPKGLTPVLTVAADGLSVELTLTGTSISHQDADDVSGLLFTFANSAFTGGDASAVENAISASSGISIDFKQNRPVVAYGDGFNLDTAVPQLLGSYSISSEEPDARGVTFSTNGLKMYITGDAADNVNQYSLAKPFAPSAGYSLDIAMDVSSQVNAPHDITFSRDGTRMFVLDHGGAVNQYSVNSPWDLTGTVSHTVTHLVTSQEGAATGVTFSPDGTKMFIVGTSGDEVNQYSLSNAFDLTTGVTFDESPFSVLSEDYNPMDIAFNGTGTEMYILGGAGRDINIYSLERPFDITEGVTFVTNTFYMGAVDAFPNGFCFNATGSSLFTVGYYDEVVNHFQISNPQILIEAVAGDGSSDGSLIGSFSIKISDDQFSYAGGSLTHGADYTIDNLPAGLTPSFSVAADGQSGIVTFSGKATNHQNINDLEALVFTFADQAFELDDASIVTNAISANSGIGVDFIDDGGSLTYGSIFDLTGGATIQTSHYIGDEENYANDLVFSHDGLKLFVIGSEGDLINQYGLVSAYDLRAGLTHEGSITSGDSYPRTMTFNDDGSKLFVLGTGSRQVHQFGLSVNFDITSTVTPEGSFNATAQEINPYSMKFSDDGMTMYIGGITSMKIHKYQLTSAYDITSTTTFVHSTVELGNIYDFDLSADGKNLVVLTGDNQLETYFLSSAFDLTSTMIKGESIFSTEPIHSQAQGMVFSPAGNRLFMTGWGDQVTQYELVSAGFVESNSNNGSILTTVQGFLLKGETFTNQRNTLAHGSDYTIANLPAGLTPVLEVANSGTSATLSFTGNATNNSDSDDISSLIFTFNNSAFSGGDASAILNTTSANSGIDIDFRDGTASITYENETFTSFNESYADDGSVLGEFTVTVTDDSFNNAGETLSYGDDYTISPIPAGLTPVLTVAADGWSALLTFAGKATDNEKTDNVSDLVFTFSNSAFGNGDASNVTNAASASSGCGITFREIEGVIYADNGFQVTNMAVNETTFDVSEQASNPSGLAFNPDGTKLFMLASTNATVNQYTLTTPYEIAAGAVLDGTPLDISEYETGAFDIAFSTDGHTMFIIGYASDKIHQFDLSTAFDINSTVTHEGEYAVTQGVGLTFSVDGTQMYTTSLSSSTLKQYALETPFDITGTVTLTGTVSAGNYSPRFSPSGEELFIINSNSDVIYQFNLSQGFDITTAESTSESIYVRPDDSAPLGFVISSDGTKFLVSGGVGDVILQYESMHTAVFSELAANNGEVSGSFEIQINGEAFAKAGDVLEAGTDYTLSGLPAGLSEALNVAADGLSITLTVTGNAEAHQDADDLTAEISLSLLDGSFDSGDAASIQNSTLAFLLDFDFLDNATINYNARIFSETYQNEGELTGAMGLHIINDTFTNAGGTLTEGEDYTIADIPDGLIPNLSVSANGLNATLTFSGTATHHQDTDDMDDLIFTFENSAFTTYDADVVFNSTAHGSGGKIDFDENDRRIMYGNKLDFTEQFNWNQVAKFSVANENAGSSFAVSQDGMRIFVSSWEENAIYQYDLTTPFDLSDGAAYASVSFDVSNEGVSPGDVDFSHDGVKMYVQISSDDILQYHLTTPFDLSGGVSYEGSYDMGNDIQPSGITFSRDGKKMYMIGSHTDKIYEYTLETPFDLTGTVDYDDVSYSVPGYNYAGILLSDNGREIYLINTSYPGQTSIRQYQMNIANDLSSGVTSIGGKSLFELTNHAGDARISPNGKFLWVLANNQEILQLALPVDGFMEVDKNDGDVAGSLFIEIDDERFTSAGSILTYGSDYTIDNLPTGLTATLDVAEDGFSATLTLTDKGEHHQDIHDVDDLQFTFNNSAFVGNDASVVANAVAGSSGRSVDFRDNHPMLFYGNGLNMEYATNAGSPLDVYSEETYPAGIVFSHDGTKMFTAGGDNSAIHQYSLSIPYQITSGVSFNGSFDVSMEDEHPEDIVFSEDGSKMYVLGDDSYVIYEYNLSTPFEITTGATYSGNSLGVNTYSSGSAMTMSPDGTKMYLMGDGIHQFGLPTPFDLTNATFEATYEPELEGLSGGVISPDGRYFLMLSSGYAVSYILNTPFDISNGIAINGTPLEIDGEIDYAHSIAIQPDGSRVFIIDINEGTGASIHQFEMDFGGFTETVVNNGAVEGELSISLTDDTFTNPGGVLTAYSITNLPTGLTSLMSVSSDGYTATVTLTGSAVDHKDTDDLSNLIFNFTDAAFTNYEASEVANATNHSINAGIDFLANSDDEILSFTLSEQTGAATIDNGEGSTVSIEVVAGTDISALTPTVTVSDGATVSPESGIEQDFTSPVVYTVTAEDATSNAITVSVTEALASPTDISISESTIDENNAVSDLVGTLSTVDASFADSHTYTLASGTGDADNASFTIDGNELQANTIFDHETKSAYSIRVQTDDGNGGLYVEQFIININDVNETPTDLELSSLEINESNPVGTVIGSFSTTDEDEGQTHTYTLVSGTGDEGNASFAISGDQLVTTEVLDYESQTSYSILVQTNDGNGGIYEESFTISVNDLAASITSIDLDNTTVVENADAGTLVGALSTAGEDLSGSFTYELVTGTGSDDNSSFEVIDDEIFTTESFNYEVKSSYAIRVSTDDGNGYSLERTFTISIDDEAESTDTNILTFVLLEQTGTAVVDNETNTISLEVAYGTDMTSLIPTITVSAGADISPLGAQDFSTPVTYTVTAEEPTFTEEWVVTLSEAPNSASDIVSFVLDEQSDAATINAGNHSISIEVEPGTEISNLTPTITLSDGAMITPDGAQDFTNSFTYTVTAQNGVTTQDWVVTVSIANTPPALVDVIADHTDINGFDLSTRDLSGAFTDVDGDNIILTVSSSDEMIVTAAIDEDGILTVSEVGLGTAVITVTADDGNGGTTDATFNFTVNFVAQAAPTAIMLDNISIDENLPVGTIIALMSRTDVNLYDEPTYSLVAGDGDTDNASFSVNGLHLRSNEVFDFETKTSYSIRLQVDDNNGGTYQQVFTITINDLEDNAAPTLTNALADLTQAAGFATIDIDLNDVFTDVDGDLLNYSVSSSDTEVVTVAVSNNNVLQITEGNIGISTITVTVEDSDGESVSDTFIITVEKTDQTISFDALADKVFGDADFDLNATASSSLDVTFSVVSGPATIAGNTVTITGAGEIVIAANQSGDETFNAASQVTQTFTVEKADQVITIEAIQDQTTDGEPLEIVASTTSGLSLTYQVSGSATLSGTTVTLTGTAGLVTVTVSQAGDDNYNSASEQVTFNVTDPDKTDQTISFDALADKVFGDADFDLNATASSSLDVTFSVVSGPATIAGSTVTITGAGEIVIAADQSGDETFNAASQVTQTFTVEKADQVITIEAIENQTTNGEPVEIVASTTSGLTLSYAVSGPATINDASITLDGIAGTVTVTVSQAGDDNYHSAESVISFDVTEESTVTAVAPEVKIQYYPNPATDWVSVSGIQSNEAQIQVFDLRGTHIMTEIIMEDQRLSVHSLQSGVYLMKITNQDITTTTRLVIRR
ncbi:Por secretion system C-terminal sorting domain-containing protein [Reichenbachiella agariperforans]|uniref:Por secretion system C-terminal sorting domain-containing protein n=1 Tax=Reichenbachiella agariperforans TaxID=156994 RepID=A0A1M6TT18_REIAG|nr:cadherin domain-containing protein [Reichenbachiella agariperforans]SHK60066.1 Por secretion system C-terminal sorting domain-containing protein [Reichenbachiella agariperforans]